MASTTRSTRSIHVPLARGSQLLISGQVIESPETGLRYRIQKLLGEGGFGQAYLASRVGASDECPPRSASRSARASTAGFGRRIFGQLLDGHPRALRVYGMFPLMRADGQVLYYLALEYAALGDLAPISRGRTAGCRRRPCAAKLPAFSRCSGNSIAASRSTAI